mgnify:CR=1 FL=1
MVTSCQSLSVLSVKLCSWVLALGSAALSAASSSALSFASAPALILASLSALRSAFARALSCASSSALSLASSLASAFTLAFVSASSFAVSSAVHLASFVHLASALRWLPAVWFQRCLFQPLATNGSDATSKLHAVSPQKPPLIRNYSLWIVRRGKPHAPINSNL